MGEVVSIEGIETVRGLTEFLETKGNNHQKYYHYTTWDSLKKIYKNKSFLLTRGNSVHINDQHEATQKGKYVEWNKTYIGSFAYGSTENMAMWGLYGLPWEDAVRIAIPQKEMIQWLKYMDEVWRCNPDGTPISDVAIKPDCVCLNDVVYVSSKKTSLSFTLSRAGENWNLPNQGEFSKLDENPLMTGYIKNYSWHYENEVRLKITASKSIFCEKIKVMIPEDVIDSFEVTTGPCFIRKTDDLYKNLHQDGKIHSSSFAGLVRYRPLCDLCKHEKFEKKSRN